MYIDIYIRIYIFCVSYVDWTTQPRPHVGQGEEGGQASEAKALTQGRATTMEPTRLTTFV